MCPEGLNYNPSWSLSWSWSWSWSWCRLPHCTSTLTQDTPYCLIRGYPHLSPHPTLPPPRLCAHLAGGTCKWKEERCVKQDQAHRRSLLSEILSFGEDRAHIRSFCCRLLRVKDREHTPSLLPRSTWNAVLHVASTR